VHVVLVLLNSRPTVGSCILYFALKIQKIQHAYFEKSILNTFIHVYFKILF